MQFSNRVLSTIMLAFAISIAGALGINSIVAPQAQEQTLSNGWATNQVPYPSDQSQSPLSLNQYNSLRATTGAPNTVSAFINVGAVATKVLIVAGPITLVAFGYSNVAAGNMVISVYDAATVGGAPACGVAPFALVIENTPVTETVWANLGPAGMHFANGIVICSTGAVAQANMIYVPD